jgi:hypothetical protein
MQLVTIPNHFADEIKYGAIVTLDVEHYGETKKVEFCVSCDWEHEIRLDSTEQVACCSVGGKSWPCRLTVFAQKAIGRARDAQYPARKRIPTWNLFNTAHRLNRSYPIRGWWCAPAEKNISKHNSV